MGEWAWLHKKFPALHARKPPFHATAYSLQELLDGSVLLDHTTPNLLEVSYPLLLLGHQLAVLTRDGGVLPNLDQQLDTGLTLLPEYNSLPAYPLLQTVDLSHSMRVAGEREGKLRGLPPTALLNLTQFMHKPTEKTSSHVHI